MPYPSAVCVFCGAQNKVPQTHLDAGPRFGYWLAGQGITFVYGGGDCGIMGAVANGVLAEKGRVTGVFPESLKEIENEHQNLTEIIMVETMHQRKEIMYQRSDVFIIFPGGFGTMDEFFEILTWKQLNLHDKPIIIFNHKGYWDDLVHLMENIIATGFAQPSSAALYQVVDKLESLQEALEVCC